MGTTTEYQSSTRKHKAGENSAMTIIYNSPRDNLATKIMMRTKVRIRYKAISDKVTKFSSR